MLSRVVDTTKRLKSYLFLEQRIPTYRERANYYKQRAIVESLKNGIEGINDPKKGFDLIDITDSTAITLPNGNKIKFARDRNGIYFARIEGSKYYPIDVKDSEDLLRRSREYAGLSRNFWRRLLKEPYECTFGSLVFEMRSGFFELDDRLFQLDLKLKHLAHILQENFQQLVKQLES